MILLPFPTTYFDVLLFFISRKCGISCFGIGIIRIGELLALEWSDIDFIKAELSVTKTCYDGQDENGKSCRITGTPKTETSKRIIPIPKQLIPHLREIKREARQST